MFAGVGSTLPASSIARTAKRCRRRLTFLRNGDEQAANDRLSSLHSKLAPASSAVNWNLALRLRVFRLGAFVISVSGGSVSTVGGGGGGGGGGAGGAVGRELVGADVAPRGAAAGAGDRASLAVAPRRRP